MTCQLFSTRSRTHFVVCVCVYESHDRKDEYERVIFPNKEIDFYNWRQLRHTVEFIF